MSKRGGKREGERRKGLRERNRGEAAEGRTGLELLWGADNSAARLRRRLHWHCDLRRAGAAGTLLADLRLAFVHPRLLGARSAAIDSVHVCILAACCRPRWC